MTKKIEKLIDTCPRCGGHEFKIPEYICDKCKWQDPSCKMTNTFIDKEIEHLIEICWDGEPVLWKTAIKSFIRESEKRLIETIKKEMLGERKPQIKKLGIYKDGREVEITSCCDNTWNSYRAEAMRILDSFNK